MDAPSFSRGRDTLDARYDHLWVGEALADVDPLGLGRIKIFVPGLCDPGSSTTWALPAGRMLGVQNGLHAVPEKDSNVVVFFNGGDVDHPYYFPGPFGSPGGVPDVPTQSDGGSPDRVVFRWRDFYVLLDGASGTEKVVFEDLGSTTTFEVDRTTGNFTRTVTGSQGKETATIKGDLTTTVQQGNEVRTITAGNRTTSIVAGTDTRTVGGNSTDTIGGAEVRTITGAKTETVGIASTETVTAAKIVTSGLAMTLTAGLTMALTAAAAMTLLATGVTLQSTGAATTIAGGLQTNTFAGGILETIVGAVVRNITGAVTETVSGLWSLVANGGFAIAGAGTIGLGPTFSKLLTAAYHGDFVFPHVHQVTALGAPTGTPEIPNPSGPGLIPMPATPGAADQTIDLTAS